MLPLISVLICNEYLQMTKVIREKKFQTICNIGQPKPWSQISGPGSGFMVLNLWSCLSGSGSWIWNLSLSSGSWIPFLRSCVLILVHSVNITKSDKSLLHSLIVIKKSDRIIVTIITKYGNYYKVRHNNSFTGLLICCHSRLKIYLA